MARLPQFAFFNSRPYPLSEGIIMALSIEQGQERSGDLRLQAVDTAANRTGA